MSKAIDNLTEAMKVAAGGRPRVGGFPHLAEVLRKAGVTRNVWSLPSCQSLYLTHEGPVVVQGAPLAKGAVDVPAFNEEALIKGLRVDQAGESTFPEFLDATWRAGVVRYDVDLEERTVAYQGCNGEEYIEAYPAGHRNHHAARNSLLNSLPRSWGGQRHLTGKVLNRQCIR